MLQTGVTSRPFGKSHPPGQPSSGGLRNPHTLNLIESKTHFYAWCVVSSPLILGLDLTNSTNMDRVWPIITNREALAINSAWVGDAGQLLKEDSKTARMQNCPHTGCPPKCSPPPPGQPAPVCSYPSWQVWHKRLPGNKLALLLMNNGNAPQDVSVAWTELPSLVCPATGCEVRDVHARKDLGRIKSGFTAKALAVHDSAFLIVSA
jgi:hypothetical protein